MRRNSFRRVSRCPCAPAILGAILKLYPHEFVAVIAVGAENHLGEMFGHVIKRALPLVTVRLVIISSHEISEIMALPELREAALFVAMINNLVSSEDDDQEAARAAFIRRLRAETPALIYLMDGRRAPVFLTAMQMAGADIVVPVLFPLGSLQAAARDALHRWQSRHEGRRDLQSDPEPPLSP